MKLKLFIPIIILIVITFLNVFSLIYIKTATEELVSVLEDVSFEKFCNEYKQKRLVLSLFVRGDTLSEIEQLIDVYNQSKKQLLCSKINEIYADNKFSLENIF